MELLHREPLYCEGQAAQRNPLSRKNPLPLHRESAAACDPEARVRVTDVESRTSFRRVLTNPTLETHNHPTRRRRLPHARGSGEATFLCDRTYERAQSLRPVLPLPHTLAH